MANPAISEPDSDVKTAYLYVIGADTGPHKVGFTIKPTYRLTTLGIGSPVPLTIKHVIAVPWVTRKFSEKYAHALLASRHSHGEWFDVTADQALSAIRLGDKGTREGRLPPGKSIAEMNGEDSRTSGKPFGVTSLTPARAVAARRYEGLMRSVCHTSGRSEASLDDRRKLEQIHEAVRGNLGEVGVTLLKRVVGIGEPIAALPGSYRQYHIMRDFVFLALDDVLRLTAIN